MPREVGLRLRAAYEASADLVADSMSDQDPILGADRAGLSEGPQHGRWRTPLLAAVAVLIVAAGTVLAIDQARSNRAASPPTPRRLLNNPRVSAC